MVKLTEPDPVTQADGSVRQWSNCGCAVGANCLSRDTGGAHTTTGAHVRALTGDTSGGTRLEQEDVALRKGYPPDDHLDVRRMFPFEDFVQEVVEWRGASLCIGYKVISGRAGLDGSPGFRGNHRWYVQQILIVRTPHGSIDYDSSMAKVYDPLWNARRDEIPARKYQWVSLTLLRRAAGALELTPGGSTVGVGACYVGFTRATPPAGPPPTPSTGGIEFGRNAMITAAGITITSSHVIPLRKGQKLYREARDGSVVVTKMAKAARVEYLGRAGSGFRAVWVKTRNFPDKVMRPVILYVPLSAGTPVGNN